MATRPTPVPPKVLEAAVQNGFLVRVDVSVSSDDASATRVQTCSMVLCADATGMVIKEEMRRLLGLTVQAEKELRLTNEQGRLVVGPLFEGNEEHQPSVHLTLRIVTLDPRLVDLFEMVKMGEERERDEMLLQIMAGRKPRDCPGGHGLPITYPDLPYDGPRRGRGRDRRYCMMCHYYQGNFRGRGCDKCGFRVCDRCLQSDEGRASIVDDPHQELLRIALDMGKFLAEHSCNITVEDRYLPHVNWKREWGDVCTGFFRKFHNQSYNHAYRLPWRISSESKVLHNGIRLVVTLSDGLKAVIAPLDVAASDEGATRKLSPFEVNKILPTGATLHQELKPLCEAFKASDQWTKVTSVLRDRCVFGRVTPFEDNPKAYITSLKLVSFDMTYVHYELGARVSDSWLFGLGQRPGVYECGHSSGIRIRGIQNRLAAANASL